MRPWLGALLVFVLLLFSAQSSAQPLAWRYKTTDSITSLSTSIDGKYIVAGNEDGFIYLLGSNGSKLWQYTVWSKINVVSISDDSSYIAIGGSNRYVYLFDKNFTRNSFIWKYPVGASVLSLDISGDGNYIAAGSFDHRVYLFERTSPEPLWSFQTEGRVNAIDTSLGGHFISAGSDDGYLYVFDREFSNNTFISRFKAEGPIVTLSISENGNFIAAGSLDGCIYFQDREVSNSSYSWRHIVESKISSVSTSSNGDYIAAGDSSGRIYLLDKDYTENDCLWSYPIGVESTKVSLSGDGSILASGCENGVYLFDKDFKNNSFLWHLPSSSKIRDVKISRDGYSLVAGDNDGYVLMFWPTIQILTRSTVKAVEKTSSVTSEVVPETTQTTQLSNNYWYILIIIALIAGLGYTFLRAKRKPIKIKDVSKDTLGHKALDAVLEGGVPKGYSLVLSSPPCDQKDEMIKGFLITGLDKDHLCVYISNTIDKIIDLLDHRDLYVVFCNPQADEIAPTSANIEKVKSIENLTELNIILIKLLERLYKDAKPIRICINNLDDILIYHKGSTIRKWLTELLPRLKKMGGTVFAPVDPEMHSKEDLHAVLGVFDGQVDVTVEEGKGWIQRRIYVSRMYGLSYSKKRIPI